MRLETVNWEMRRASVLKAVAILEEAEERFYPKKIFFLCSGGHDSVVASSLSDELINCGRTRGYWHGSYHSDQLVYINTRTGLAANREFVLQFADLCFWRQQFREVVTPESYETWCMRHGFPGPSAHRWMYIRLKERCIDQLVRENTYQVDKRVLHDILNEIHHLHPAVQQFLLNQIVLEFRKAHESRRAPIMFITGAREQESFRRSQHVTPIQPRGRQIWVSPLADWSKEEVLNYRASEMIPRNLVADLLGRSKDCLCGAFAHAMELQDILTWFPEEGAYILDLQQRVRAAGFPWDWGSGGPPPWWSEVQKGQLSLWPAEELELRQKAPWPDDSGFFPMCSTCATLAHTTYNE